MTGNRIFILKRNNYFLTFRLLLKCLNLDFKVLVSNISNFNVTLHASPKLVLIKALKFL